MQQQRLPQEVNDALAERTSDDRAGIERVWEALGALPDEPMDVPSEASAWEDIQRRIAASRLPRARPPRRPPRHATRLLRWSTAGLGVALVLFAVWWQQPVTVIVPMGTQQEVVLPDGSVVELNSASQLRYARGFTRLPLVAAAERSVELDGEAFFRVLPGSRPFVVETFNSRVEVLGTQFNVRARSSRPDRPATTPATTAVTLAEGRVQVSGAAQAEAPTLLTRSGDHVTVGTGEEGRVSEPVVVAQPDRFWAWRDAGFAFVDVPMADIVAELERRFALRITLEPGLDPTGTLSLFKQPGTTVEEVLHDLCLAQQCRYRTTSQGFAVAPATVN